MTKKPEDNNIRAVAVTPAAQLNLKRNKPAVEVKRKPEPPPVTAGSISDVMGFAFNPSREKIREVTVVDRVQGRLLPQLDIIDMMWQYIIEIATFRQDSNNYVAVYEKERPVEPNLISEFTYRTAQWQKSIGGTNLKSAVDITLADIENQSGEEEALGGGHGFEDD